jgi:hypothetical protein
VNSASEIAPPGETRERNWLPLVLAAAVVLVAASVVVLVLEHGKGGTQVTPLSTPLDPYASNLPITGGKVTYLDGHITNTGGRTITGVTVQVLFRDAAHEVTQNETHSLKVIRMREPYIDIEPISAAPLMPGEGHDFRLIFDSVSPDWNGAFPELRVVHLDSK